MPRRVMSALAANMTKYWMMLKACSADCRKPLTLLLGTGGLSSEMVCPLLGSPVQKGCTLMGESAAEGYQDDLEN